MTGWKRRRLLAVVLAGSLLSAGACTGAGADAGRRGRGQAGGTLTILMVDDFQHLDPARNYSVEAQDFGRLLYRTLTTYRAVPGRAGAELVGDLATDTGTPGDGGRTWTFTLRPGLRYQDGSQITAADVKYGVERAFDPQLPEGPQYLQRWLADVPPGYHGPQASGRSLGSIEVHGRSITFRLSRPVGEFPYAAALTTTSPVPRARDTGGAYDHQVVSSGPYQIATYQPRKTLTLVRNRYWWRSTDSVRHAYPDRIVCTFGLDPVTIDQRLIADSPQDRAAIALDSTVRPESTPRVTADAGVARRSVWGRDGFIRLLAINTAKVRSLLVRQAINYAVDKETYRTARGGNTAGEYATTMLTPDLPGYRRFDLYPAPPRGDEAKARDLLRRADVRQPVTMHLATPVGLDNGLVAATAVQAALKRVGITVVVDQLSVNSYFTEIGDSARAPELMFSGWAPDWPSPSTVLVPLFDGRLIQPHGNNNLSQLRDPAIDAAIDRVAATVDPTQRDAAWSELDRQIMAQAPVVPLVYSASLQVHGSRVAGAYVHAFYRLWDLVSLSVR